MKRMKRKEILKYLADKNRLLHLREWKTLFLAQFSDTMELAQNYWFQKLQLNIAKFVSLISLTMA